MRFSLIAIATAIASVAAQDLSKIPACAVPCFVPAIQGSGCGISDIKCQCTTGRQSIQDSVASCVPSRCQANDIAALTSVVGELCAAAGVTVTDLPSAAPSGSGAAATSNVNGTASRTQSRTATGSAPAAASTAAAPTNLLNIGAVAMGLAAFAL